MWRGGWASFGTAGRRGSGGAETESFESLVNVCLNTLSALDQLSLSTGKALMKLYKTLFLHLPATQGGGGRGGGAVASHCSSAFASSSTGPSPPRGEGTHRAFVVCQLLQMRIKHMGTAAFGEGGGERLSRRQREGWRHSCGGPGDRLPGQREGPRPAEGGVAGKFETEFAEPHAAVGGDAATPALQPRAIRER